MQTAALLLICAAAFAEDAPPAPPDPGASATAPVKEAPPPASDGWFCLGHDAAHTYTSKDVLPSTLKLRWSWVAPANGDIKQVVGSDGAVLVHARHVNPTPIGDRIGCHNYLVDLDTGALVKEDPDGTNTNDWCKGYPVGSYGGRVYQADDGNSYIVGRSDVWGAMEIDPDQKVWAVLQHYRVDGPNPGIYLAPIDQNIGASTWFVGHEIGIKEMRTYNSGDLAIGPGVVYAAISWSVTDPKLDNGLVAYELATGAKRWAFKGEWVAVSAGKDFCVGVMKDKTLGVFNAADGKVIWQAKLGSLPECPPMVTDTAIRVYETSGALTSFKIAEKAGKRTFAPDNSPNLGKYQGPRMADGYHSAFCYGADGTLFVANGGAVMGAKPGGKQWTWKATPEIAKDIGGLGQPAIIRGKLLVTGPHGVLCFDAEGAPPKPKKP